MKIRRIILIAFGIVLLAALPMQSVGAYGGPWSPCARLTDPIHADPFLNPFGPSPGQIRACQRRMWKYGPPPWMVAPPPRVAPVVVLQVPAEK